MLRLVFGYKNKGDSPEVLYCGTDGDEQQRAIDAAGDAYAKLTRVERPLERRAKKTPPSHVEVPVENEDGPTLEESGSKKSRKKSR